MYKEDTKDESVEILIDAFSGNIVTREQASQIIGFKLSDKDLIPYSKKNIITRIIRNLIHLGGNRNSESRILYIDAILAIDPTDHYTRAMRAMHYYADGNYIEAVKDIDLLISANPNSPELTPLLEIKNRLLKKR